MTDQSGFLKGRHLSNSIRWVINIINHYKRVNEAILAVFMDAKKAFDHLKWHFMFATLENFGVGSYFLQWIKLLYSDQKAEIDLINLTLNEV